MSLARADIYIQYLYLLCFMYCMGSLLCDCGERVSY